MILCRNAALQDKLATVVNVSTGQGVEMTRLRDALQTALVANSNRPFMSAAYFLQQDSDWIMKHTGGLVLYGILIVHVFVYFFFR